MAWIVGQSPIGNAERPTLIQSACRWKRFQSVETARNKSHFATSIDQPIRFPHVCRSTGLFETTPATKIINHFILVHVV